MARPLKERVVQGARQLAGAGLIAGGAALGVTSFMSAEPAEAAVPLASVDGNTGADIAAIAARVGARRFVLTMGEAEHRYTFDELGISLDEAHMQSLLDDAANEDSPLRQLHQATSPGDLISLRAPYSFDRSKIAEAIMTLKRTHDESAVEARMNIETKEVLPHRDGRSIDVWGTVGNVILAGERGERTASIAVADQPAGRRTEDLAAVRFDHALGRFSTRYDASFRSADRTHNLRVAASKLNGHVVLPGEEFDFNVVVGDRTEGNGFKPATVIAGGELANGLGGGTCQISGTLHAAALFAGLQVTERHPHSRPSSYIKLGLDAMVSFPEKNLRFVNNTEHPIVIGMSVEGGSVETKLFSAAPRRMVTFTRRIDSAKPFRERTREDSELPAGVRVLVQRGVPGFRVRRWRIVRDVEGNQAIRRRTEDIYPPTMQIVRVGTGGAAPEGFEPPPGDSHREYVADSFLEMTQGPGIRGIMERKRAGRTGSYGWTQRESMGPPAPGDLPVSTPTP